MCDCFVETENVSRDLCLFPFLSKVGFFNAQISTSHTISLQVSLLRAGNLSKETENWQVWKNILSSQKRFPLSKVLVTGKPQFLNSLSMTP